MMHLLRPRLGARRLNALTLKCNASKAPSETTTVMLKKLHPSATAATLQEAIDESGLRIRKTLIEPGCAVQLTNEVHAECVATLLKHEFGCSTSIAGTMFPALLLKNISSDLSSQDIKKSFQKHDPKGVHLTGGTSFTCHVEDNLEAIAIAKVIQDVSLNGQNLNAHLHKLADKKYSVHVTNVPHTMSVAEAQAAIEKAVSVHSNSITVTPTPKQGRVLTVRIPAETTVDTAAVIEKLSALSSASNPLTVAETGPLKLPALFLRNVSKIGKDEVEKVMAEFDFERMQFTYRSKDVVGDLAVVYFKTQAEALACLSAIKNVRVNGKRLSSSYRETAEPGIVLTGLDLCSDGEADEVMQMFSDIDPVHYVVRNKDEMVIVTRDQNDAATASIMAHKCEFKGKPLNAEVTGLHDNGFAITMGSAATSAPKESEIRSALESVGVPMKDVTVESNLNAFVTFETLHRATLAQHGVEEGSVEFGSETAAKNNGAGRLTSAVTVYPANAVAVEGLSEEIPVSQVSDFLKQHGIKPICIDRSAILKFKRHMEVVPGIKKLKAMQLGGLQLKPERYRRLEQLVKDPEYDTYGNDEVFDSESLNQTMKDYLHTDPATRLQIARNSFERAIHAAKQNNENAFLHDPKAPPQIQEEINYLMEADEPDVDRLFELFIQREDMHRFAYDFRKLTALFGKAEGPEKDPFNWSSFKIDSDEELMRLREAMRLSAEMDDSLSLKDLKNRKRLTTGELLKMVDERRAAAGAAADDGEMDEFDDEGEEGGFAPLKARALHDSNDGDEDDEDDIRISEPGGNFKMREDRDFQDDFDEDNSPENMSEVTDRNGYVWSGMVINTDTTTTTLPSGRLMTHRCLVMVGNMKGAGGFGMGKGENSQLAMKRAFRDAVKNVFFVDLYDNFGLAHDLMGKHNACRVYIRATPRGRMFVGSPLSRAILNRFGISSASVRIVGRRDPYAVCRAFSYALQNHENLDEFARDRGLRYLTLRWIYDNKI